jgi:ribosomal protein S18 acetylase RimI-like enzyme
MLNGLSIRVGQDKDADVLAAFNVALARETEGKDLSLPVVRKGVQKLLENPQYGFYVVAETAAAVVGSAMITFEWSDWRCGLFWWFQSVYVKPQFRRQGVFRKLYEFVRERASRQGLVCGLRVYVEQSNRAARDVYAALGMERTGYDRIYEQLFPGDRH